MLATYTRSASARSTGLCTCSRSPALGADRLAVREEGPEEDKNLVSDWPLLGTRWIDARAWDLEAVHQLAQPPGPFETCVVESLGERASLLRLQGGGVGGERKKRREGRRAQL